MPQDERQNGPGEERPDRDSQGNVPPGQSPETLRGLAAALESAAAEALASVANLEAPLTTGDLKEFPRPESNLRAAEAGLEYLRESLERAVAMLHAIAEAREQKREVPAILFAAVQPFITALETGAK